MHPLPLPPPPPSPAPIILLDGHNYSHHYVELKIYNIFTSYNS